MTGCQFSIRSNLRPNNRLDSLSPAPTPGGRTCNVDLRLESELVVLLDYRFKIRKKKYQIERNKRSDETQCDDCKQMGIRRCRNERRPLLLRRFDISAIRFC
jgi:hypothetical protein